MRNSKISVVKFLLLGIAMLMLGSSSVFAQISVTLPSVTKLPGSGVDTLVIQSGDVTGKSVSSFQFKLYYNKNVAYITDAVKAGLSDVSGSLLQVNSDTANGVLSVAWANANTISGSGTLIKIVVAYRAVGTTTLSFDNNGAVANTFIFNGGSPAATVTNGSINVPAQAVSFGTMSVSVGDTVLIPITTSAIKAADDVVSFDFTATFNPAVIKVLDAQVSGTLSAGGSYSANPDNTAGTVRVAWGSGTSITTATNATLIYLKAVVIGAGTSTMGFNSFRFNTGTPAVGFVAGTLTASTVSTYSVSGVVAYNNATGTPLKGAVVTLTPAGGAAMVDTTDANGAYSFTGLMAGTYSVSAAVKGTWSGVNAADALVAARYYNGLTTLDTVQVLAGDVTGNGQVNNTDALDIVKRYVGLINSFTIGDWVVFPSSSSITITSASATVNFKALVAGDLNESYNPASPKQSTLSLLSRSELNIRSGGTFEIPISVASNMELGAVSVRLSYPQNLAQFDGISVNGQNVIANEKNGVISIAWADLTGGNSPLELKAGSVLATIKFTANKGLTDGNKFGLDLLSGSEFVNAKGDAIANAALLAPEASVSQPSEFTLKQNYPNPFNPSTTIDYSLPADGNVTITIFNVTGQQVAKLVNGVQNAGSHRVVWNASNLSSGIYFYQINFDGPNKKFTDVKSMVLLK